MIGCSWRPRNSLLPCSTPPAPVPAPAPVPDHTPQPQSSPTIDCVPAAQCAGFDNNMLFIFGSHFGPTSPIPSMWLHFEVLLFWDAGEPARNHMAMWFPSVTANIGTIHITVELRINLDTESVSGEIRLRNRRRLEHYPDDEVAPV